MIHNANVDFVYSWMYIFQVDIETTCWIGGVAGKGTYVMQISRSSMSLLVPRGLCPASKLDGNFAKAVQIRLKVPSSVYVCKSFNICPSSTQCGKLPPGLWFWEALSHGFKKLKFQILTIFSQKSLYCINNLCVKTKKSHCTVLLCPKGTCM